MKQLSIWLICAVLAEQGTVAQNGVGINDDSLPMSYLSLELLQKRGVAIDSRRTRRLQEVNNSSVSIIPMFQGMGTHYSYIYVGTPPQRVSVILDTGSHHTAFPCLGCNCGQHMDPYFDPEKSTTSKVLKCANKRCHFQQAYSEGSSWHAYKVSDRLWMGGEGINDKQLGSTYDTVNFQFGCQESETGLFRTQHVDGIMGMSANDDTLPFQLHSQLITKSKIFAMCFSSGGGILTLGGVNQLIHNKNEKIKYAALIKTRGWFTVKLLDVFMRPSPSSRDYKLITSKTISPKVKVGQSYAISIDSNIPDLNGRKGVIVDSGTTDTYLPASIKNSFEKLFKKLSGGIVYSNNNMILKQDQYDSLPIIIYRLEGVDGKHVHIENHPSSYAESLGNGNYAFRVYLSEPSGAVLGANFMNNHNVIFDIENKRVGFVKSTCKYDYLKENFTHNNNSSNNNNNNNNNGDDNNIYIDKSNSDERKENDSNEKSLYSFEGLISSVTSHLVGIF